MEKVEKKSYIEKTETKYIAFDGKEFDRENDCLAYEYETRISRALETVPCCKEAENLPNPGFFDANDNHSFYWFRPRDSRDIRMLEEAFRLDKDYSSFFPEDVGQWICIEFDWETGDSWVTRLYGGIHAVKHTLGILGYNIVVTEKQSGKRV